MRFAKLPPGTFGPCAIFAMPKNAALPMPPRALARRSGLIRGDFDIDLRRVGMAAFVAFAIGWTTSSAFASVSVTDVQKALVAQGSKVLLTERAAGDPYLDVVTRGIRWRLYFVDCSPPGKQTCQSMTMVAAFSHVKRKGLDITNVWNGTRRFTRAFLDGDGDPNLATDVMLADASPATVDRALSRWASDIQRFRDFLGP